MPIFGIVGLLLFACDAKAVAPRLSDLIIQDGSVVLPRRMGGMVSSKALLLGKAESWKALANKLSSLEKVRRHDDTDHNEAWTLAHAFADLEESSRKFLDALLPKLVEDDLTEVERLDLLFEIGEELRHILYHIRDPRFYRYLD